MVGIVAKRANIERLSSRSRRASMKEGYLGSDSNDDSCSDKNNDTITVTALDSAHKSAKGYKGNISKTRGMEVQKLNGYTMHVYNLTISNTDMHPPH